MNCSVCGSSMSKKNTTLPFKISEDTIIIIKEIPAMVCSNCGESFIEGNVMDRVDAMLSGVNTSAELEVYRYTA